MSFSFDGLTGDLYLAEVGGVRSEEVNVQPHERGGGQNYGWPYFEGLLPGVAAGGVDTNNFTLPTLPFPQVYSGGPIVGGYVYRGQVSPRMFGVYIFADRGSGRVFGLVKTSRGWASAQVGQLPGKISSFAEDEQGNLYAAGGQSWRLASIWEVSDSNAPEPPEVRPPGGVFVGDQTAAVSCATPGAVVHYTTEDRDPTEADPIVWPDTRLNIRSNLTLRARAFRPDLAPSPPVACSFALTLQLTFDRATGPITNGTSIEIRVAPPDGTIRYTLDGTEPALSSPIYSGPVALPGNATLKARAFKGGYEPSLVLSQFYGRFDPEVVAIEVLAGAGGAGNRDGPAFTARFNDPQGLWAAPSGVVIVADTGNHCIRRISASGFVATLSGNGTAGYRDGPAGEALFKSPAAVCGDASGALFVADRYNFRIRKLESGIVSTYAGTGRQSMDDLERQQATFTYPSALVMGTGGGLYVADWACVRMVPVSGAVQAVAGPRYWNGGWSGPVGMTIDQSGTLYATACEGWVWRIPAAGVEEWFMGGAPVYADGPRLNAGLLGNPYVSDVRTRPIVADRSGRWYVADGSRIRKVTPDGTVRTLAPMTGRAPESPSPFGLIGALAVDNAGTLYAADAVHACVWRITPDADADGIPDALEDEVSGFTAGVDDRLIDSDGDGASNAAEYAAGTDPRNRQSVLELGAAKLTADTVELAWQSVPTRLYALERSVDLVHWTNLTGHLPGTGSRMGFVDTPGDSRYYRLKAGLSW